MNEFKEVSTLVKINEEGKCLARDIWSFLGVKSNYRDWFKRRSSELDLKNINDYSTLFFERSDGGKPKVEHEISIDLGKEMAMLERNKQGKLLRKYFIEAEKKLRQVAEATKLNSDPSEIDHLDRAEKATVKLKRILDIIETPKDQANEVIFEYLDKCHGLHLKPKVVSYGPVYPVHEQVETVVPTTVAAPIQGLPPCDSEWMIPKEIGEYLSMDRGENYSAQRVNQMLVLAGMQVGKGKNGAGPYQVTKKGCEMSTQTQVQVSSYKGTKNQPQIHWDRNKTLAAIADYL